MRRVYSLSASGFTPVFWWCMRCSSFLVFCAVFVFLSSSCVLCPMFPVSLDFPFLMALSLDWVRVAHHLSFLSYGFCLLVFVLCLMPDVACVSGLSILDCPFFCHPWLFGGVRVTPLFSFLCWVVVFLFVFVFVLCLMHYGACLFGLFIFDCSFGFL